MKKRTFFLVGALALSFALGMAAFAFLPGLFSSSTADAQSVDGGRVMEIAIEEVIEDENGNVETISGVVQIKQDNPPGLPELAADASGLYLSHTGNRLTLGTGGLEVEVSIEQINDQEPVMAVSAVHSGPEIEIKVAPDATIYFETTEQPKPTAEDVAAGEMTMLRQFKSGSLDDLAKNTTIEAWGTEQNGVLVADTLIISPIK